MGYKEEEKALMVANRKLSVYIWLFSLLPVAGFLGTVGLTYFNSLKVAEDFKQVKIVQQKILEMPNVPEPQRNLVQANTRQVDASLNSLILWLGVATVTEVLIFLIAVYLIVLAAKQRVTEVATEITASSGQIAVTMEEQERMANQQAASVHQTTTTIDELWASSKATATQAENVASGARMALNLAEGGTKTVGETLERMSVLKDKVEAIAQQIVRLSQQTSQIGNIAALVGDLANQTNMLALNAAVEAVRAGEHGKGFAVVAAEIRKLADQSQKSTERINALVADIQMAINSTVMVTDAGTKTVEEGAKIGKETAEAFRLMSEAINDIWVNTQQISLSAKQQAIAVQQVVDAMNALNQVAAQTAESITQVKIGTQQLNAAAQKLNSIS
ncbi:methyl-accepting chemotaxis protein [Ancylothrix sp. C2]|uniref:methyl-accepting chemotaxis protein n=1 Tax=Ancylothrix sp. D3o TaxID=2953691 RepID=UPI0021BA9CD6|nr:methyl-accepting chemotaxis protein [Ancylothrix sp. D3o]MCT7949576.1 methyl-accepting chemotaxis protein [Ancylothrix sp. D3o]